MKLSDLTLWQAAVRCAQGDWAGVSQSEEFINLRLSETYNSERVCVELSPVDRNSGHLPFAQATCQQEDLLDLIYSCFKKILLILMTYYVVRTFINIAFIFSLTSISNCYYYVPTLGTFYNPETQPDWSKLSTNQRKRWVSQDDDFSVFLTSDVRLVACKC